MVEGVGCGKRGWSREGLVFGLLPWLHDDVIAVGVGCYCCVLRE